MKQQNKCSLLLGTVLVLSLLTNYSLYITASKKNGLCEDVYDHFGLSPSAMVDESLFYMPPEPQKKIRVKMLAENSSLTETQITNLMIAESVGAQYDLSNTLMGICMQESKCGKLRKVGHYSAPVGKRSYGIMQIKVSAALDVQKHFPEIEKFPTEEELISTLMHDNEYNMEVAARYVILLKKRGLTWRETLAAYNLGPAGMRKVEDPSNYKYVIRVIKHIRSDEVKNLKTYLKSS